MTVAKAQLEATEKLLKSGFISVDIFAASPVDESKKETAMVRRASSDTMQSMTGFGVGEESDAGGQITLREMGAVAAPIDKAGAKFRPGSTARVDVVVRTRKIGHFFPGGTVDAFDIWLELEGRDASGKMIYWSGAVEDDGRGRWPAPKGRHGKGLGLIAMRERAQSLGGSVTVGAAASGGKIGRAHV